MCLCLGFYFDLKAARTAVLWNAGYLCMSLLFTNLTDRHLPWKINLISILSLIDYIFLGRLACMWTWGVYVITPKTDLSWNAGYLCMPLPFRHQDRHMPASGGHFLYSHGLTDLGFGMLQEFIWNKRHSRL